MFGLMYFFSNFDN